MSELDLDAIDATRDMIWECKERPQIAANTIRALTAELRACRAERDLLLMDKRDMDEYDQRWFELHDRAERAEANLRSLRSWADGAKVDIKGLRDRAERAEAEMVKMGRDHTVRLQVRDEEEEALRAREVIAENRELLARAERTEAAIQRARRAAAAPWGTDE